MKTVSVFAVTLFAFCPPGSCTPVNQPASADISITSEGDIPYNLRSNGFSYRIVDRVTEAKAVKTPIRAPENSALEKRADAVHCLGPGNSHPLQDDCSILISEIASSAGSLYANPGYCHEAEYGTCKAFYCDNTCSGSTISITRWAQLLQSVNSMCVAFGQNGIITDSIDDAGTRASYQAGLEHSGSELPAYANGTC
ncbi:hypothetical protein D6D10_01468 [Aureobasidium pullulans]|uniref:Uncharacterized protein n=1 Tax=Aureobasidium pullulans TaxID=5580 RepID=A0A4S9F6J8_AURPU|nr:hypothetical protein D6D10_01468 [Aureobasidium pullulans]